MKDQKSTLPSLSEQIKAASELLEAVSGNRELLASVSVEEQRRLLKAAGQVSRPDSRARRQLVKEYGR